MHEREEWPVCRKDSHPAKEIITKICLADVSPWVEHGPVHQEVARPLGFRLNSQ